MAQIDHIFILMLENRSFDHFFGLSRRVGVPRPTDPGFGPGAADRSASDPPHEFAQVQSQINNGAMDGFDKMAKLAFLPGDIPVVSQLADEFLLFDNWYSSVPGPTWPNRFFAHAGSSGGLASSPRAQDDLAATTLPWASFKFQNGTVFDRLTAAGKKWRVYHGDLHPQVLSLEGMVAHSFNRELFRSIYPAQNVGDFAADLQSGSYDVAYTFIEPNYAIQLFSQFVGGDSQHPQASIAAGEGLIKFIYETIRNSSVWPNSLLLILWDEHGGFYDQKPPPSASPPGDAATNRNRAGPDSPFFAFDRLGVRVPALLVSPWIQRNSLGSAIFPGKNFDHSSVIRSLRDHFALGGPLTGRDQAAPSWTSALSQTPRSGASDGPLTLRPVAAHVPAAIQASYLLDKPPPAVPEEPDAFIEGVALIALDLDRYVSANSGTPALATEEFKRQVTTAAARTTALASGADFKLQLLAYIRQVDAKVAKHKTSLRRTVP